MAAAAAYDGVGVVAYAWQPIFIAAMTTNVEMISPFQLFVFRYRRSSARLFSGLVNVGANEWRNGVADDKWLAATVWRRDASAFSLTNK